MGKHISAATFRGMTLEQLSNWIFQHADDLNEHNVRKAIAILQERVRAGGDPDALADDELVNTLIAALNQ
jgi:hypothetical protein